MWNLDEALSSQLAGKQTKCSEVSAAHCTQRGADCVCNTLVPEMGPPFWEAFPSSGNIAAPFLGPVFGPIFGDHEKATRSCVTVLTARISSICWHQPSFCNASRHGHTHPYNTMRGHGAEAALNQWKGSTFRSRKTPCWPLALAACRLYNAYVRKLSCVHLGRCVVQRQERTYHPHKSTYDPSRPHLRPSNPHARSAPTTFTAQPTTLQDHTYDPQTRMPGAHLRPSQLNLRPFKATPTTLKPACQERTYDPHSSTYDPSRPHLQPSNPHVRKSRRPFAHFGRIQRY